jgi:hypothetical protein
VPTLAAPTATASATATSAPIPTETPVPSATPTITPTEPVFLPTPTLYYPPDYVPGQPQPTVIPTAMPRFRSTDENGNPYELMNVLLLGHDGNLDPGEPFHTDTMIVVSVNRDTNTVSMISLPRDLFVYIPNWGMARLNLAWGYGESIGWTDGGWGMMRQTLLYNFGIETHYYAMVDFEGFEQIIEYLEGVTIAVDCPSWTRNAPGLPARTGSRGTKPTRITNCIPCRSACTRWTRIRRCGTHAAAKIPSTSTGDAASSKSCGRSGRRPKKPG